MYSTRARVLKLSRRWLIAQLVQGENRQTSRLRSFAEAESLRLHQSSRSFLDINYAPLYGAMALGVYDAETEGASEHLELHSWFMN